MSWNDERVDLLSRLWLEGRSASQIAAELGDGVTRNAVIGKVHRLGLSSRIKPAILPSEPQTARLKKEVGKTEPGIEVDQAAPVPQPLAAVLVPVERRASDVVIPISSRVTIMDLRETMCRWPLGDPSSAEFRYCGCRSAIGPYCREHASVAFQPAQDRRRVERLARIA